MQELSSKYNNNGTNLPFCQSSDVDCQINNMEHTQWLPRKGSAVTGIQGGTLVTVKVPVLEREIQKLN